MLIDLSCPVENLKTTVRTNSETGQPYLLLKLLNISKKTITSLDFTVKAFDDADNEVASIPIEFTDLSAAPREFFAENKAIPLDDILDAKKFSIEINSATFEGEETPYTPSQESTVDYDDSEASLKDALALREMFPDAVCFAKEYENYWRCACGRPNSKDDENCVRCGTAKEDALNKYSSKTALNAAVKEKEELEKAEAEEQAKAAEAKKQRTKKNLIIIGIIVAALTVASVAGYFIYGTVKNHLAEKEAEQLVNEGNYLEAYKLYSELGDDRMYDIQHLVMGNTPENLLYGLGTSAEDSEYLYYIAFDTSSGYQYNLIKKNKVTSETTILTDAAYGSLNVVGDYIYFVNNEYYPCRMDKSGKSTEILFETPVMNYMSVVGTDIYYIKTDYDNPNNLSEEQCQTLAAQGQMAAYQRLHKYNLISKEDTLISTEEMQTCAIFDKRIYYLTYNDEDYTAHYNLKSMSMKGTDIKSHVDSPVILFTVKGEDLYYISQYEGNYATATEFSEELLGYSIKKLNLSSGAITVLTDADEYVTWLNASDDLLVYTTYNRQQYISKYYTGDTADDVDLIPNIVTYNIKTGEEKIIATLPSDYMSINGNDLYSMSTTGGFFMIKTNGSDAAPIYGDGTSNPPEQTKTELSPDLQELYESMQ